MAKLQRVPPPSGGLDLISAPDAVAATRGQRLLNVLPGRAGVLPQRGGLGGTHTSTPGTPGSAALHQPENLGLWMAGNNMLWAIDGTHAFSTNGGLITYPAGLMTFPWLRPSHAQIDGGTVGVTFGSGGGPPPLMFWNGATTLVPLSNGPRTAQAVAAHLSRVFVLGGSKPGTTTPIYNNRLWWTDIGEDLSTDVIGAWQDDVSGLVREIKLPAGDIYYDLISFQKTLYIFGRHTVLALTGLTSDTFAVRKVLDIGTPITIGGSAGTTQQGVYFWSDAGVIRFDGAVATPISGAIAPYHSDATGPANPTVQFTPLPDEYISVLYRNHWLLYHERTGAWSELSSPAFGQNLSAAFHQVAGRPMFVRSGTTATFAWDSRCNDLSGHVVWMDCATITRPEAATTGDGNSTWPFDVDVISRVYPLSTPLEKANVRRMYADVLTTSVTNPWSVQLQTEAGTAVGAPLVTSSSSPVRQRLTGDIFSEAEAVRVRWTRTADGAGMVAAIYDAYVLADAAQQR